MTDVAHAQRVAVVAPPEATPRVALGRTVAALRSLRMDVQVVSATQLTDIEHGCVDVDAIVGFVASRDAIRRTAAARGVACAIVDERSPEVMCERLLTALPESSALSALVTAWPVPLVALRHVRVTAIGGELHVAFGRENLTEPDGRLDVMLDDDRQRRASVRVEISTRSGATRLTKVTSLRSRLLVHLDGDGVVALDRSVRRLPDHADIAIGPHQLTIREPHRDPSS